MSIILGIETSCDETSVAVVTDDRQILSHIIVSQLKNHAAYGGVVPEIAARAHGVYLQTSIEQAIADSGITLHDLSGIAATTGPGLIGGVMVGMMAGKAMALGLSIPFLAINHIEAHILTARLTHKVDFPFLCLLVSGGHTHIICARALGDYQVMGSTRDDAAGECFDKAAKMMGLPFPGGPSLEKIASNCDDVERAVARFPFTIPMQKHKEIVFSFSGLKTAVKLYVEQLTSGSGAIKRDDLIDLAASFQDIMARSIAFRLAQALNEFKNLFNLPRIPLVICGGVAANGAIRQNILALCERYEADFIAPPPILCTDNGAMIAWAGLEYHAAGKESPLSMKARPRWALDDLEKRWIMNA